jgi:hypothetical protein
MRTNHRRRVFGGVRRSIPPKTRFGLYARISLSKSMLPHFPSPLIQTVDSSLAGPFPMTSARRRIASGVCAHFSLLIIRHFRKVQRHFASQVPEIQHPRLAAELHFMPVSEFSDQIS